MRNSRIAAIAALATLTALAVAACDGGSQLTSADSGRTKTSTTPNPAPNVDVHVNVNIPPAPPPEKPTRLDLSFIIRTNDIQTISINPEIRINGQRIVSNPESVDPTTEQVITFGRVDGYQADTSTVTIRANQYKAGEMRTITAYYLNQSLPKRRCFEAEDEYSNQPAAAITVDEERVAEGRWCGDVKPDTVVSFGNVYPYDPPAVAMFVGRDITANVTTVRYTARNAYNACFSGRSVYGEEIRIQPIVNGFYHQNQCVVMQRGHAQEILFSTNGDFQGPPPYYIPANPRGLQAGDTLRVNRTLYTYRAEPGWVVVEMFPKGTPEHVIVNGESIGWELDRNKLPAFYLPADASAPAISIGNGMQNVRLGIVTDENQKMKYVAVNLDPTRYPVRCARAIAPWGSQLEMPITMTATVYAHRNQLPVCAALNPAVENQIIWSDPTQYSDLRKPVDISYPANTLVPGSFALAQGQYRQHHGLSVEIRTFGPWTTNFLDHHLMAQKFVDGRDSNNGETMNLYVDRAPVTIVFGDIPALQTPNPIMIDPQVSTSTQGAFLENGRWVFNVTYGAAGPILVNCADLRNWRNQPMTNIGLPEFDGLPAHVRVNDLPCRYQLVNEPHVLVGPWSMSLERPRMINLAANWSLGGNPNVYRLVYVPNSVIATLRIEIRNGLTDAVVNGESVGTNAGPGSPTFVNVDRTVGNTVCFRMPVGPAHWPCVNYAPATLALYEERPIVYDAATGTVTAR